MKNKKNEDSQIQYAAWQLGIPQARILDCALVFLKLDL